MNLQSIQMTKPEGPKYYLGSRKVITNLWKGQPVYLYVTASVPEKESSYRLFVCTLDPGAIQAGPELESEKKIREYRQWGMLPLGLYSLRWKIETSYYETKTFWSFCSYRIRSAIGIERLVNLVCISYAAVRLLPYYSPEFAQYQVESPQEIRYQIGEYSTDELKVKDGKYQEALKRCQERLEQVKEDSAEEADVYRNIGGIYAEYVRDKDLAIQNINKAIDIDERNKDEIGLAEDYTVMSSIYIYVGGEAEDGLAYLDKAEQIYKMYNLNSFGLSGVLMNKSRLYQDEGKLDEALKMLKEAQEIYDQKQEKDYVLHLLTGGVYLEKNDYKFAEEQYIEVQKGSAKRGKCYLCRESKGR